MTKEWQKVDVNDVWNFKNEDGTYSLKKDDEIEGILEEVKSDVGPNASNLYTLKMEDKKRVSVWGTSILDTRLKNVEIGEAVKIIYLGEFEGSKSGRSYHSFDVFHKEAQAVQSFPLLV